MDRIAARLADGRPYLAGDRFTAADLTFAAMTAPSILPSRYGVTLPDPNVIPEDAAAFVRGCREHPAGAFAMRLYDARPKPRGRYERPLAVEPLTPWERSDRRT
jgi:glutathione S-transferase